MSYGYFNQDVSFETFTTAAFAAAHFSVLPEFFCRTTSGEPMAQTILALYLSIATLQNASAVTADCSTPSLSPATLTSEQTINSRFNPDASPFVLVDTPVGPIELSTITDFHRDMCKMLMVRTTSDECKAWYRNHGKNGEGKFDIVNVDVLTTIATAINTTPRLLAWLYFGEDLLVPEDETAFHGETPELDFTILNARAEKLTTRDGVQHLLKVKLKSSVTIDVEFVPGEVRHTFVGTL
jgi:hypothetical protein